MGLSPIDRFSLESHTGPYAEWPRTTRLLRDGARTQTSVPGYALLRQYALPDGRALLITDWDCPYEEATEVLLLGPDDRLLARRSFGAPYASVWLSAARVVDDGAALELELCDCERWRVEVLERRPFLVGSLLLTRRVPERPPKP